MAMVVSLARYCRAIYGLMVGIYVSSLCFVKCMRNFICCDDCFVRSWCNVNEAAFLVSLLCTGSVHCTLSAEVSWLC